MGRTFRYDKKWGGSGSKKGRHKKVVTVKKKPANEESKDDFWDDPTLWDNEGFEKFNDKRARRKGF
jgi:hypothetical protein